MGKPATPPAPPRTVTRDDLERGFLKIQHGVKKRDRGPQDDDPHDRRRSGLVLTIVVFLLGRRSGKKKTTYVEIRRV